MAAGLCCSIEMEPRTLNQGQLSHAREVAADIAQTMEAKEAAAIFIEGLRPIVSIEEVEEMGTKKEEDDDLHNKISVVRQCQCSIITYEALGSPDLANLTKEPLSAPF